MVTVQVPADVLEAARHAETHGDELEWQYSAVQLGRAALRSAPRERKLKPEIARAISAAMEIWVMPLEGGMLPAHAIDMCAKHAIGLLQVETGVTDDWYEEP